MEISSSLKRSRLYIWGAMILLVGVSTLILCLPDASPIQKLDPTKTPLPTCEEEGTVWRERIESQTQGWPINFEYYLPPCYETFSEVYYPVIYLIPGNGSSYVAWNSQGHAAEIADKMIRQGLIEPFILVTTGNYPSDPEGKIFLNDLFPYIDDHFRTKEGPRYRVVGGASLGGINAYRMAFQHPEVIGSIGLFGSGLINGEQEKFSAWLNEISAEEMPRVLIDYGEDDFVMALSAQWMMEILDEEGVPYTLNVEPGDHSFVYWSGNLDMYLQWFAEDW